MNERFLKTVKHWFSIKAILSFALVILCVLEFTWLIREIFYSYETGELRSNVFFHKHSQSQLSPNSIQPWMTFDYVNFSFHLPPDYLRTALNVQDSRYPRTQINRYAKRHHLNGQLVLQKVKEAVANYK